MDLVVSPTLVGFNTQSNGHGAALTPARFHEVFLIMAIIPLLAIPGFMHLRPEDGMQVSRHVRRRKPDLE